MQLRKRDADRLERARVAAKLASTSSLSQPIENVLGKKFGRGVGAFELRQIVKIAIVEGRQRRLERFVRTPDIDDDAVRVECFGEEGSVDDECRAMQRLRRAENSRRGKNGRS